ncbi:MAG: peptidase [Herbinix sp.]|nr:peptidase [Herbinix sp.]
MNTIFLTSMTLENMNDISPKLNNINNFVTQLKKYHKKGFDNFVYFPSNPITYDNNDSYANLYCKAFENSDFKFNNCILVDNRNSSKIHEIINDADIIILGGGELPRQNTFFNNLHLKQELNYYDGIIVGMSAGSMNLADIVFDFPELDEHIGNPNFLKGLGFTDINIVPHYKPTEKNYILESGLDAWATYVLPHSNKIKIYALVDGTHILIQNNHAEIFGEAYLVKDSLISKICNNHESYIVK